MITRVKGTQDYLDVTLRNFIIETTKKHLELYNFTEIVTPILEKTELFKRAVGLETDIVSKEMYFVHSEHKSLEATQEEDQLCLRPEITAPVVRAFLNAGVQVTPWKVFTIGPAFRHERPQKGRYREFYQISMEIIGTQAIAQDALCITMLDRLFSEKFTLDNYALLINFLGCKEDRARYREKLHEFLAKNSATICATCTVRKETNILRALDCKNPTCQELYKKAPHIADTLCEGCGQEWSTLKNTLEELSISFTHAPLLVRGLDYYSKTIFEFVALDTLGAQSTFCGGGRYDSLASQIGAKQDYPAIGASIGLERLTLILEAIRTRLNIPANLPLFCVLPMSNEQHALALHITDELQAHNFRADVLLEGSFKSMMRKANTLNAAFCIIIGTDEQTGGYVTVKNMLTGEEQKVKQVELVDFARTAR